MVSVFVSASISLCFKKGRSVSGHIANLDNEKFRPLRPKCNYNIVRSVLALVTLQIGGNIAYASITGSLANSSINVDYVTLYSGVGDAVSAFFGGGPVEAIISGTAVAPNPIVAGIAMMLIMAVLLFAKLLPQLARFVANQTIAGFLLVLGAIVVFPVNIQEGLAVEPVVTGVTATITATTDPFLGMLAGVLVRSLSTIF